MNQEADFRIHCDPDAETLTVSITARNPKLIGRQGKFTITQLVNVHDSRAVNDRRTAFTHSFTIREQETEIPIKDGALPGFDYSGKMIDIELHCKLTIDDGVFFDTKVERKFSKRLLKKPKVFHDTKKLIEPKDCFNFFSNLRAIPLMNQVITLTLALVGMVIIVVNTFIGIHDQAAPESATYFYSHVDSDGDGQSPFVNSLCLSGGAGFAVWLAMRRQLRKYMTFRLKPLPLEINRQTQIPISDLIAGRPRVDLENVCLRVVACNMEKGQYVRGSGSNRRTVSFSEPVRGVLLFEQSAARIPRRASISSHFDDLVDFAPMFNILYPPCLVSKTHGLAVYWEVQLLHEKFVDQELIGPVSQLREEDFFSDGS